MLPRLHCCAYAPTPQVRTLEFEEEEGGEEDEEPQGYRGPPRMLEANHRAWAALEPQVSITCTHGPPAHAALPRLIRVAACTSHSL